MVGIAEQRAAAYKLLSLCFHPPDEGLLEVLREADLQGLCPNSLPALDELRKDHTQLFVGPFRVPAPPYGSVYLEDDGRVCGESTMDMIARYGEEGLRVTLKEPADHVAIELEYMYLLVVRQMEATAAGDEPTAARYLEKQRDFLQTHLGAWMPMLSERIVENAHTEFYRHVASATASFVSRDLDLCSGRISPSACGETGKERS
ncbi:MAG: TorD/DmsD family molecular chaperone [Planctomycetota bacterium]|jgi:TorA maturation chaperone TorD